MKSKMLLLFISVFMMILITGCNNTPSTKNETDIIEDISACKYYLENYSDFSISELEIVKRQTDVENKIDKVNVILSVTNNDESIQGNIDMQIVYGLYNEGWVLDSCEVDFDGENSGSSFIPLKGLDLTLEEISSELVTLNGEPLTELNIINHEFSTDEYVETYTFTGIETHKYLTKTIDATLTYTFMQDVGKWGTPFLSIDSENDEWNIGGTYAYTDRRGKTQTITISPDFLLGDYPDTFKDGVLLSTNDITPGEYFAGTQYALNDVLSRGYSVTFDGNLNFYSFDYCIAEYSKWANALFIGKDNIALYIYDNCTIDNYNKEVIIKLSEAQEC